MKRFKIYATIIVFSGVINIAQAVSLSIVYEMYQHGELSESEYIFKRAHNVTGLSDAQQQARIVEARSYRGKANGVVFRYTKRTLKDIDDLFDVDEDICDYVVDKYAQSLKNIVIGQNAVNQLTKPDLEKMRFVRCMSSEGWRKLS
ncbi:MAG: hypothetical protein ACWIPH_04640 [Ostreibacterium sp.]